MSASYTQLYDLAFGGLALFHRLWGVETPRHSLLRLCQAHSRDELIDVFNNDYLQRDFTGIDDIVDGFLRIAERGPAPLHDRLHRVYNIGNNRPERLLPMQRGDVYTTAADISAVLADYGFQPTTAI